MLFLLLALYFGLSFDEITALHLSSSPVVVLSSRRRCSSHSSSIGENLETSRRSDIEQAAVECGDGFYKQTGPDGDYCVLDYDAIFAATTPAQDIKQQQQQDEHYWDALESQNAARRKFGLADLTREQYVALQAENHATGQQNIVQKTAEAFAQFDTNDDGVVCIQELRAGLQKILRTTDHLSASRAQKVMEHFDDNGDGLLQPHEFMTVGQLRERLDAVIEAEREEMTLMMASMTPAEQKRQQQQQQDGGVSLIGKFFNMFADTCESNFDCSYPEVCCDLGFKKSCCSSGQTARNMRLEYATAPVPQNS